MGVVVGATQPIFTRKARKCSDTPCHTRQNRASSHTVQNAFTRCATKWTQSVIKADRGGEGRNEEGRREARFIRHLQYYPIRHFPHVPCHFEPFDI